MRNNKKNPMRVAMTLLTLLLTTTTAWAWDLNVGDTWDESTKTLTINSSVDSHRYETITDIVHLVVNPDVISLEESAFFGCSELQDVTFASGSKLTTIGDCAFSDCTALTSITLPASVITIGEYAFSDCTALTSIAIPASVKYIEEAAFKDCEALESVTFAPDSKLKDIGTRAFNCTALTSITIPASVTTIGIYAFQECEALESVIFASGSKLGNIGDSSFSGCTTLTSITIPASVTTIGSYAFEFCEALTTITIPASVTSIGEGVFDECTSMTDVYCYANPKVNPEINPNVLEWGNVGTSGEKTKIHVFVDKLSEFQSRWSSVEGIEFVGDWLKASYIDGNYWTTFYYGDKGFKIDDTENACAYTATVDDDVVILHKLGKVIPEGTAVIIVGEDDLISMTADDESVAENTVSNDLRGVDVETPLNELIGGSQELYVLSNKNNNFGFHYFTATNVPAHKAYLVLSAAGARSFSMVFEDEATGVKDLRIANSEHHVYDLNGRIVNGNNLKSGIYIKNGKKVVIK